MTLQPFTSNFADNSTEAGFQFTFYCDVCKEGYKTAFVESRTYKKGKRMKNIGNLISAASYMTGNYRVGHGVQRGSSTITERFRGMSPDWHKEHQEAFERAQNEAKGHFHRCPRCQKYVCETDWNEQEGLCVQDAPRQNVEVAAARAGRMMENIREKSRETQVFDGEIDSRQTLCPQCGKPAGEGKFCSNCGFSLQLPECSRCGAKNQAGARFCGECGNRME